MTYPLTAETVRITGHGSDEIEAYRAQPTGPGPYGGVVAAQYPRGAGTGTVRPHRNV